jgi:hypothetical protein
MASSADLDGDEAGSELPRSTRAEASCAPPRPTSPGSGCNGLMKAFGSRLFLLRSLAFVLRNLAMENGTENEFLVLSQ